MSEPTKNEKVIHLIDTKVAVCWRNAMYLLSAFVFAKSLYDFSNEDWASALNLLGMACVLVGLSFRSQQAAVFAYIQNADDRIKALEHCQMLEKKYRPWLGYVMKAGWAFMFMGIGLDLYLN